MQCAADLLWFVGVLNLAFALGGAVGLLLRKLLKEEPKEVRLALEAA